MINDTIAAISTALGVGAIGIVRLSGPAAPDIMKTIFKPAGRRKQMESHKLTYGQIIDPADRSVVDESMAVYLRAPRTYTREEMVEFHCHGGPLPLQRTLELVLNQGARLAEPGEMTLRAFLNGRIDLAQAESVMDVIGANTEAGLRLALDQLGGRLSTAVRRVRTQLLQTLAYLTALVDFAEEDIPPEDVTSPLQQAIAEVERLIESADAGIIYRQGVRVALVGRPNVGKSSLLNALLGQNRAIVTPIPGTTRDTLEETLNVRGVPVVLVDTAGITETSDIVEQIGIERSRAAIARADLPILVLDWSQPLGDADRMIAAIIANTQTKHHTVIIVLNKRDQAPAFEQSEAQQLLPQALVVTTSALEQGGLDELENGIHASVMAGHTVLSDQPLVTNPRHRDALQRAAEYLRSALAAQTAGYPADLVGIDVTAAANALGEITGETVGEDLLHVIFSRVCIGK